ncbi:MAG TPA: nuclear transport factor 2 family protein [Pseudomonadales bacterium]|nr:nuclear transport factor 2 family protein [Pseudomonadales bacterium]
MKVASESLKDWLRLFSQAVRERDLVSGRKFFHQQVVSFGTVCFRAENLEDLVRRQWEIVWPGTQNFDFDYNSARAEIVGKSAVLITHWQSTGFIGRRASVSRRGRATIALKKTATGWKAFHTHFSIDPLQNDPVLRKKRASGPGIF